MKHLSKHIFYLQLIVLLLLLVACNFDTIVGEGNVIKQKREIQVFDKVFVQGAFEIVLKSAPNNMLEVEADSNLLQTITTIVKDSVLDISTKKTILKSQKLKIFIYAPNINQIKISGAVELLSDSILGYRHLLVDVSGAARVDLNINTSKFETNVSGGAEIFLNGNSSSFAAILTGAGRINAFDFHTDTSIITLSGIGIVNVKTNKLLDVTISGAGKVVFKGDAQVVKNITGAGKVEKAY